MSEERCREKIMQDALFNYVEMVAKTPKEEAMGYLHFSMRREDEFKVGRWVRLGRGRVQDLKFAGVYALFMNDRLVYVGSSCNVGRRLRGHFYYREMVGQKGVRVEVAVRRNRRRFEHKTVEAMLIHRLNPPLNKNGLY